MGLEKKPNFLRFSYPSAMFGLGLVNNFNPFLYGTWEKKSIFLSFSYPSAMFALGLVQYSI